MADLTNQEKLEETYRLAKENNEMLHSMLRQQYFAIALRSVYLLVIIGAIGGAYYYISPIIAPIISAFTENSIKVESTLDQLNQFRTQMKDTNLLDEVVKTINSQTGQ